MEDVVKILDYIDMINDWVGRVLSMIIIIIMFFAAYEVVMRYFFSRPTIWVREINSHLLCISGAFAGGYAMLTDTHVSVDIVSSRLTPHLRSLVNLITSPLFFIFVGALIWFGTQEAWRSIIVGEREISTFASPLYITKSLIPIGAVLLFLQGIAKYAREFKIFKETK